MTAQYRYEVGIYMCQGLWDDDEKIDEQNYESVRVFIGTQDEANTFFNKLWKDLE